MTGRRPLRIGTSAFVANGWRGTLYPKGTAQREYPTYYSQHFDTVEIDSTLYGTPDCQAETAEFITVMDALGEKRFHTVSVRTVIGSR